MRRVVVVFMEEDAALAAVRAGQVDVAATSAVYSTQAVEGYELLACKSVDSRGVSLPVLPANSDWTIGGERQKVGNDVTCDLAVRRAMNYATDRDEMVENVLNGHGSVAYGVSDGMPWSPADARFEASVDAAKAILADGGWASGADGIVVKNGRRASFELCYPVNDSVRQSLANDFANQMRRIGIEVKVSGLSWDDLYPKAYTTPILWGWGSNSPSQLYDLYHSSSSSNFSCYADNDVDASLEAALAAKTVEESFPFWQSAQWDGKTGVSAKGQATWLWLANIDHLYFKRANLVVARQKLHPHGHGWAVANNVDSWQWR
jgi:peptide/nickel transport system substrate-binding protein